MEFDELVKEIFDIFGANPEDLVRDMKLRRSLEKVMLQQERTLRRGLGTYSSE